MIAFAIISSVIAYFYTGIRYCVPKIVERELAEKRKHVSATLYQAMKDDYRETAVIGGVILSPLWPLYMLWVETLEPWTQRLTNTYVSPKTLQEEIKDLKDERRKMQEQLNQRQLDIMDLEDQVAGWKSMVRDSMPSSLTKDIEKLQKAKDELERLLDTYERENIELKKRLEIPISWY